MIFASTGILTAAALAIWLYLLFARGGFWRCAEHDNWPEPVLVDWPNVAVVVPARNEAVHIGASLGSLLGQQYQGCWTVILVDDESSDETQAMARLIASGAPERVQIIAGEPLPAGWTGKLWALKQGVTRAMALPQLPHFLLFTDADIVHEPDTLSRLVAFAQNNGLGLVSLMAKLHCDSFAEHAMVPAFIFFFQMLYPFAWVNQPKRAAAAAAGGCVLVRATTLAQSGGIEQIRGALIDDCALARNLKWHGPIWLGLTDRVRSIRSYPSLADIRRMVARSAYAQLHYSVALLLVTVAAMAVTYLVPPLMAVLGGGIVRITALTTWALMAIAFQPTLRFYRLSPVWGIALPVIALLFLIFTLDSALQYMQGRGGTWKGRVQADLYQP